METPGKNPSKLNNFQLLLIAALIVTAVFFRFWQIKDYVVFLGDEGRDSLVMRKMIVEKQPTFLGPTASVGGFYLGPIYYYMGAPFLWFFNFDPIGPSYMVALFGVATVVLLYKFLHETVGFYPALLASALYATAPLIVRYSRSSWNPNPLPFFALLLFWSIYIAIIKNKPIFYVLAGACFGIAIQLHYLSIMLIPLSAIVIVLNTNFKKWPLILGLGIVGAFITFSPFLLFEIKNGFPNFHTISEFVTRDATTGFKSPDVFWLMSNFGNIFLEAISKLQGTPITRCAFWLFTAAGFVGLVKNWKTEKKLIFSIGLVWFIGGLAFLRYYTGQIFDYYFGFMFPAPFLLTGLLISLVWKNKILRLVSIALVVVAIGWFLKNGFYTLPPNRLIFQTQNVANFVIEKTENKPYNFALITDSNSDHAYRYFLEKENYKPLELETMITDQLLVVCESKKSCSTLGHPLWEIAGFGRAEIVGEWEIPNIGIKVIKLVHWSGAPSPAGKPAVKGI